MKISALTFVAFYINSALDKGGYEDISIDIVRGEIQAGTIFSYLEDRLASDIDLSLLDVTMRTKLIAEWKDMEAALNISRKFGVTQGGLTLIMAFLLESIQRLASGKA